MSRPFYSSNNIGRNLNRKVTNVNQTNDNQWQRNMLVLTIIYQGHENAVGSSSSCHVPARENQGRKTQPTFLSWTLYTRCTETPSERWTEREAPPTNPSWATAARQTPEFLSDLNVTSTDRQVGGFMGLDVHAGIFIFNNVLPSVIRITFLKLLLVSLSSKYRIIIIKSLTSTVSSSLLPSLRSAVCVPFVIFIQLIIEFACFRTHLGK